MIMEQDEDKSSADDPTPEALEESAYRFYDHIWTLLQQNTFFIAHGFYVFPNGERWTVDELSSHADHTNSDDEDKDVVVKKALQNLN